ncbi:MAG TPA: hypothetical protein VLV86_25815 [Vicinamibacterales bacterium]|nr:hypothetical protein [Vicinamibacterales bacterium]
MQLIAKSVTLAIAVATALSLTSSAPMAQAPATQGRGGGRGGRGGESNWPPSGPAPRAEDGHPDLSGNWQPNAIRQNVDLVGSGVDVPMLPDAAALYKKRKDSQSKDDPEARCMPPGVPRMSTTPYPWTIVQTPKLIVIVYEGGAHIWRKVFMDGRPHDANAVETWLGDSIGHWEGDTLVVETVGQTDKSWLDESGIPHSTEMKVTERITRPDFGHLDITHIIDDPKTFSRPWSFTTHPSLLRGELIEYICQENNRDVEHLVGK